MAEITCSLTIAAPQEKVFRALTSEDGIASWWTDDTMVARNEVRLGFENGSVTFRMKIAKMNPPELLEWECIGDQQEWTGTKLSWVLRPTREGGTNLSLAHVNWRDESEYFGDCQETWPEVLARLKAFAETGTADPYFK